MATSTTSGALQRAFGLDRDFWVGVRRPHASQRPELLVALLVAGDLDILRIDVLAEPGHLVGAERVGARDDTAAILDSHSHLCIGHRCAVGVLPEAKLGGPFLFAVVVVVAESCAARPQSSRQDARHANAHACDRRAPTWEFHHCLLMAGGVLAVL